MILPPSVLYISTLAAISDAAIHGLGTISIAILIIVTPTVTTVAIHDLQRHKATSTVDSLGMLLRMF